MSNSVPSTIDIRLFWISAVMLYLLSDVGLRAVMRRRKGRRRAMMARLCAAVSLASAVVLVLPLFWWSAVESAFGQLFSWFCTHGVIAFFLTRMGFGFLRDHGKV